MKICITQKLQILKSYAKLVFNTFSFEPSKKEIFLVYREVPELLEITGRPSSSSLPSLLLCFACRPPYAAGGPRPWRIRGQVDPRELSSATWPASWHLPTLTRVGRCQEAGQVALESSPGSTWPRTRRGRGPPAAYGGRRAKQSTGRRDMEVRAFL